jgi:hypothetical protein
VQHEQLPNTRPRTHHLQFRCCQTGVTEDIKKEKKFYQNKLEKFYSYTTTTTTKRTLLLLQITAKQVVESEQAVHVALAVGIALQLKELSHPFVGLESLLKCPALHVKSVHVEESEQAVQVAPVMEGQPTSHPLLAMPSSSNLLAKHDTLVQEDRSEQSEHEALATEMAAQYLPPRQVTL